ncbi:MAG: alpha/beta fold hydrolase [Rhodoferax sp.]|nr:alpha/beta fold hydrolase [Rhodoferax sp.]MCB2007920.1 alpha/beta fold hydrolase [Rhodoferax sp.]MCB2031095.1 alpha/beta fold hydrolase [Rhodoferax sp.]MCB2042071.1 alpha/beta fold hydrolase [Rhodoferax sp.]
MSKQADDGAGTGKRLPGKDPRVASRRAPRAPDARPVGTRTPNRALGLLRSLPSLWQLLRRKAVSEDKLPHARFSATSFGIRSLVVAGTGSPTVVFESGIGQGKRNWAPVFNRIAELTRAVAYDRAGYGQSEISDQPRDGLQIVLELREMLRTEGLEPPYVLVGHSLGGTMVKLFAKTWPDEVAGVVLVDARHEEFTQRCRQVGVHRLLYEPPETLLNMLPPVPRAELLAAPLTLKQARRAGSFPDVPLIVLTQSNATSRWPESLGKVWLASQRRMAGMSALGRIKVVGDAGHNLHMDRPDVVVRAVTGVVRAARLIRGKRLRTRR